LLRPSQPPHFKIKALDAQKPMRILQAQRWQNALVPSKGFILTTQHFWTRIGKFVLSSFSGVDLQLTQSGIAPIIFSI